MTTIVWYAATASGQSSALARDSEWSDATRAVGALRDAIGIHGARFTVKTRIGFDSADGFDELLALFARHSIDLLTVHGRTVAGMYRSPVQYDLIARAAQALPCPVLANGNIWSAEKAHEVVRSTGVVGVMIGRGCIRNPWIFEQIRSHSRGTPPHMPTGREVLEYIHALWEATEPPESKERLQVEKMKKYMNFLGAGVGPDAAGSNEFLHRIRRAVARSEFFDICRGHLDHSRPMPLEPLVAENNASAPLPQSAPQSLSE